MHRKKWIPEFVVAAIGRSACRVLDWHGVTCRGRADHLTSEQCSWHPVLYWMGC